MSKECYEVILIFGLLQFVLFLPTSIIMLVGNNVELFFFTFMASSLLLLIAIFSSFITIHIKK